MKKNIFLICLFILIIFFSLSLVSSSSNVKSEKIDKRVYDALASDNEIPVLVKIKENSSFGSSSLKDKRVSIKNNQKGVLDSLNKSDFRLKYKYDTINGFSGKVTARGLEKLKNNPNVESVQYDHPVSANLDVSVPLINATKTWPIQINGQNLTGRGQTVCIIDTGIDYTHPALGGCSISKLSFNGSIENLSVPIESPHNYSDNYNYTWTINMPGYSNIAIHFRNMTIESNYDQLKLYDKNGKEFASYSGTHNDIWSASTSGDTIKIVWQTDPAKNFYGIYIDQVLNGTTNMTYDWSNCSRVIGGWDFSNSDGNPIDDNGHGTHVAGIVASNDSIYRGVAPDVNLIAIKALDASGSGTDSDVAAGIDWCINRSLDYNISVITMSLGCSGVCTHWQNYCDSDPEVSFTSLPINIAKNMGISVVVASGNNGWADGISSPACVSGAIPVGAVNDSDSIFYNRGSLLSLLAPGVSIRSTLLGGGFGDKSGTSMATPHVAGAFAIMNQYLKLKNQTKTPRQIESIFNLTGKRIYDSSSGLNYSRIDVYGAIMNLAVDLIYPNYTNENISGQIKRYTNFIYNITLSDNLNLSSAWFESNFSGVMQNYSYNLSGLQQNLSLLFNITSRAKNFSYHLGFNDSSGNTNYTNWKSVNIVNTPPVNYSIENQSWVMNSNRTINLSQYFYDVDMDNLIFSNSAAQNVSVIINQSSGIAILIPDFGFNGTSYIKFNANDSINITASNNVSLDVFHPIIIFNKTNFMSSSTNFSNLSNFLNISIFIEKANVGSLNFSSVSLDNISNDLDSYVNLSYNLISINSSILPGLNRSAILSLYNITFSDPVMYKDGIVCSSCYKISYFNGTFIFNVTGFSSYNLSEASCSDGLQNQNETGVDCGGPCASCPVYVSSGGGGGGGGMTTIPLVGSQNLSGGYVRNMYAGDRLVMNISGVNHSLSLNKIINNSFVNITIRSDPVNFVLARNEERKINLTSSDYYDLSVKVENISANRALILLSSINESINYPIVGVSRNKTGMANATNNETSENSTVSGVQGVSLYIIVVVGLFFLIIIFVVYVIMRFLKHHKG